MPVALAFSLSPGPNDSVDAIALVQDRRVDLTRSAEVARFAALVDRLPAGVLVWDGSGVEDPMDLRLRYANRATRDTLGTSPEVLFGRTIAEVFPAVDAGDAARLLALCGTDRVEHFGEIAYSEEGGATPTLYRWQALALPGDMVAAVFEDISAQRAGEVRRRALLHRLLDTSDAERRRLAMDLHDDAVQQIAAAAILVEGLQRHRDSPHLTDRLSAAEVALRGALGSLRRLVFELSPPELVESGLEGAVRSAADYLFADTDTSVTITVELALELPMTVQTTAFRIVAEALTNTYKHAQAEQVWVRVSARGSELVIEVADDGIGLQQTGAPGHIGLRSMQERAAAQGGTCSISSVGDDPGTMVRAVIPTTGPPATTPVTTETLASHDDDLTALRQRLDSVSAAAGEARRDAWHARHQLRTAMEMVEALLDPTATVESLTRTGVELLGQALRAGCAIHLLSPNGQQLQRSASWHADPEQLAGLNTVGFADRPLVSAPQARTVLASGEPVMGDISTAGEVVRRHVPELPIEPHSYILAPLIADRTTMGTVTVVRDQAPERFTNDDVEFVKCASAQIGISIVRARARP